MFVFLQDELKEAMEMIGEPVSDEDIDNMITMADLNKDGKIDYEGMHLRLSNAKPGSIVNYCKLIIKNKGFCLCF